MDLQRERPVGVREIASHLGVTARTVRRWMATGLEHVVIGRTVRTTWEAVERFASRPTPASQHVVSTPSADHAALLKKYGCRG